MSLALSASRVVLDRLTEVSDTASGKRYFAAFFRAGLFGRPVRRAFFGTPQDDGTTAWERASPDDLAPLVGHDLAGHVSVEAVAVEPKEITIQATGEVRTVTNATVVKLQDETLEGALRIYGFEARKAAEPLVPAGHFLVGGDGASL